MLNTEENVVIHNENPEVSAKSSDSENAIFGDLKKIQDFNK